MLSMNSILFAASSNPSEFGLPPVGLPSVANNHSMVMHSSQYCCRQCREPMWNSESGREALFDRTISLKELRCACHCWLVNCAMCKDLSCVECYCTVTLNGPVRHLQCNFQNVWKMCVCVCVHNGNNAKPVRLRSCSSCSGLEAVAGANAAGHGPWDKCYTVTHNQLFEIVTSIGKIQWTLSFSLPQSHELLQQESY